VTPEGLHHLAIKVNDPVRVAAFYRDVLGLAEVARHPFADGTVRSIWLALGGDAILMIERSIHGGGGPGEVAFADDPPGIHLVALRIRPEDRTVWRERLAAARRPVEHETEWTLYARDPEGNRVGLSCLPLSPPRSSG